MAKKLENLGALGILRFVPLSFLDRPSCVCNSDLFVLKVSTAMHPLTVSFDSLCSARSKVRGTLEIYHAYIRDTETSRGDADWEIVDNNSTPVSVSCYLIAAPFYGTHTSDNAEFLSTLFSRSYCVICFIAVHSSR